MKAVGAEQDRPAERAEVDEVRAGDEEHDQRGADQDRRRADVRLAQDEQDDRAGDHQEDDGPAPERLHAGSPAGEPVGQVDDEGELRDLGRMEQGQRPDAQEAGRPADHVVERRDEQHDHEQGQRDDEQRHRDEPPVAVVDPGHDGHRDEPEGGPDDLRADDLELVVVAQERGHRRRRIDHEHADRHQADDRGEEDVVGLVLLALERVGPAPRRGQRLGDARSSVGLPGRRPPGGQGSHGRLEGAPARRVVHEHVEDARRPGSGARSRRSIAGGARRR